MTEKKRTIDLRFDTVTLPTQEMMEAIRTAELGDDVLGEDPTTKRLEELAAKTVDKEAALLTTSGTQGNLLCVICQTKRGDEVILEAESHHYYYELGSFSVIGGLVPRLVKGHNGVMTPEDIEAVLRPRGPGLPALHFAPTSLICIENPHHRSGNTLWTPAQTKAVCDFAHEHGLKVHLDGSRIFDAAVALDVDVRDLTRNVDTVMFCLSKTLSAPIGSIIAGTQELIDRARMYRKMLGGGMRQTGIIAAPGIIAIEKMVPRLKDDHANAKLLAKGLSRIPGITIDLSLVQTNMVLFEVKGLGVTADEWIARLDEFGVKAIAREDDKVFMTTHRGIEKEDIEYTLRAAESVAKQLAMKRGNA